MAIGIQRSTIDAMWSCITFGDTFATFAAKDRQRARVRYMFVNVNAKGKHRHPFIHCSLCSQPSFSVSASTLARQLATIATWYARTQEGRRFWEDRRLYLLQMVMLVYHNAIIITIDENWLQWLVIKHHRGEKPYSYEHDRDWRIRLRNYHRGEVGRNC